LLPLCYHLPERTADPRPKSGWLAEGRPGDLQRQDSRWAATSRRAWPSAVGPHARASAARGAGRGRPKEQRGEGRTRSFESRPDARSRAILRAQRSATCLAMEKVPLGSLWRDPFRHSLGRDPSSTAG